MARYALAPSYGLVARLLGFSSSLPITTANDGAVLFAGSAPESRWKDLGFPSLVIRLRMVPYCSPVGQSRGSIASSPRELCLGTAGGQGSAGPFLQALRLDIASTHSFPHLPREASTASRSHPARHWGHTLHDFVHISFSTQSITRPPAQALILYV